MLHLPQSPGPLPSFKMQVSPHAPLTASTLTTINPSQNQSRIHAMLRKYITAIRRDDFLPRLNSVLQARFSASPGSALIDIEGYYANRPELRDYTLGVELDRAMEYTIIMKDGQSITDKNTIRSYFGIRKNHECRGSRANVTDELLIRAANQSLLADALIALTGTEEVLEPSLGRNEERKPGLILGGPLLSMTSMVEKCHFSVDLQGGKVEAICVLAISVPDGNQRLVLARAILVATFQPGEKCQLHYSMKLVKAHHTPGSETLRDAAKSLSKDQDNLLFQSMHENAAKNNDAKRQRRPFFLF
eukprot:CAMPEP_0181091640 /NCGR_PEP_ID=MMETSP1071-20121207/8503_1 /TAXON_ID=35127 /ORGANISM="Thalassiosira sp., Strain NH16" /LENGTH=302 /DNA_ID=CAMNT_0023173787 /DNA_START=257 /DNA_END=1165 /DNA_ORIENTATION=+